MRGNLIRISSRPFGSSPAVGSSKSVPPGAWPATPPAMATRPSDHQTVQRGTAARVFHPDQPGSALYLHAPPPPSLESPWFFGQSGHPERHPPQTADAPDTGTPVQLAAQGLHIVAVLVNVFSIIMGVGSAATAPAGPFNLGSA